MLSSVDYLVFVFSLLICAVIGIYYLLPAYRRRQFSKICHKSRRLATTAAARDDANEHKQQAPTTAAEYFLGSRSLSFIPVVLSLFATNFSAIGMLGLPAEVYAFGTAPILSTFSFVPASIIVALVFIPIYYRNGFNSIFEYIEKRFQSVLLRKITTTLSALSTVAYCAVCAYVPCVAFEKASGIPEWVLIIATGFVTVFYTTAGGIRAVVLVDALQAGIMLTGIIAVLIIGSQSVGGIEHAWQIASASGRTEIYDWRIDLTVTHSFWSIFCGAGFFFLAATNNQSTLQRSCSLNSLPKAIMSLILVGPLAAILSIILWLTTLVAYAYFSSVVGCDPFKSGAVKSPNQIMSYFVSVVMDYPGFRGLYFACLFSGSLSTLSTSFNSVSSVIWEDWLKTSLERRLNRRQISFFIKFLVAITGVVVCLLALSCEYIGGTAIRMVTSFTSAFSGTILAVFIAAAFLPFITSLSLIIGMCVSVPFVLTVIVSQIVYKLSSYPWLPMVECQQFMNSSAKNSSSLFSSVTESITTDGSEAMTPVTKLLLSSTTKVPPSAAADLHPALRSLFSLSYNYFPILCIVTCLGIASIISLISFILSKALFPNVDCLKPPANIKPTYMAIGHFCLHHLSPVEMTNTRPVHSQRTSLDQQIDSLQRLTATSSVIDAPTPTSRRGSNTITSKA